MDLIWVWVGPILVSWSAVNLGWPDPNRPDQLLPLASCMLGANWITRKGLRWLDWARINWHSHTEHICKTSCVASSDPLPLPKANWGPLGLMLTIDFSQCSRGGDSDLVKGRRCKSSPWKTNLWFHEIEHIDGWSWWPMPWIRERGKSCSSRTPINFILTLYSILLPSSISNNVNAFSHYSHAFDLKEFHSMATHMIHWIWIHQEIDIVYRDY